MRISVDIDIKVLRKLYEKLNREEKFEDLYDYEILEIFEEYFEALVKEKLSNG